MAKKSNIHTTDLGAWLGYSRQSIYRFIKAYDEGNTSSIDPNVLATLEFIKTHPEATRLDVMNYIKNELNVSVQDNYNISKHNADFSSMYEKRYALMGRMLDNPNAMYENISYLTPSDLLLNGTSVEDHSDELSDEDIVESVDRLNAFKTIYETTKQYTRRKLSGKRVWFSDSQKSFIAEFEPNVSPDHPFVHDYTEARIMLEAVSEILGQSSLILCPLIAVSSLKKKVDDAINSIRKVEETKYPDDFDKIRKEVREINIDWAAKTKVISNGWYECVAIVSTVENDENKIELFFDDIAGASESEVKIALNHSILEEYKDGFEVKDSAFFGPFATIDEALRIGEYLSIEWDVDFGNDDASEDKALNWFTKQKKKKNILNGSVPLNK